MIEIIKTKDGYMVQHMDGELEGECLCDAKGDNLFDKFADAENVMWEAFDKDQTLMTESRALLYYTDKLAKHGWHITSIFSIKDVKDRINAGTEIVEMPSDYILNEALANVCRRFDVDITDYLDYAQELAMEWKQEETK
jgi:phenylalanine-4-hydroxylase